MRLSMEQQAILDGSMGRFPAKCMKWLVDWGEAMGAQEMLPVEHAMPAYLTAPGHTLKGSGNRQIEDYIRFIGEFLEYEAKCPACSHIARFDLDDNALMQVEQINLDAQNKLIDMGREAGIAMTWSCAPYQTGAIPMPGQVCAWTESHAVVLVNSFFGARTTRNSGETALAAGITGWIPAFGALLDEGRKADLLIRVEEVPQNDLEWGLLGYWAGKHANIRTPAFTGIGHCRLESAKQICAGLAASGGSTMLHIVGVTPEAPTMDAVFPDGPPTEVHTYNRAARDTVRYRYDAAAGEPVDVVYFGCPHASHQEIIEIARLLRGKRVHADTRLIVSTSYSVKAQAERLGWAKIIEDAGGVFMVDTCPLQAPYLEEFQAWRRMATNAVKQAHYARAILGCDSVLGTPARCVDAAITGRWE